MSPAHLLHKYFKTGVRTDGDVADGGLLNLFVFITAVNIVEIPACYCRTYDAGNGKGCNLITIILTRKCFIEPIHCSLITHRSGLKFPG